MFNVLCKPEDCFYEIYEIISIYYPRDKIIQIENEQDLPDKSVLIKCECEEDGNGSVLTKCIMLNKNGESFTVRAKADVLCSIEHNLKKSIKHCVKLAVFKLLKDATGIDVPWGILVGIRPSKIVNELKTEGADEKTIDNTLKHKYLMRDDKIKLVKQISDNSCKLINTDKRKVSVYIGIPFCPSKCEYCSFASYPIAAYIDRIEKYMECLQYEIEKTMEHIKGHLDVETLYIGGGTPTSLDDVNFKKLLDICSRVFDIDKLKEYTVEGGRPDTINKAKLDMMKSSGVTRISINPQSMNNATLKRIGRCHTVEEIIDKYNMARAAGFDNINMDMILGLSGEGIDDVKHTLNKILELSPENITVHTLAVKRASKLKEKLIENESFNIADRNVAEGMMDYVVETMDKCGYLPYYMYRQKMMVGNLENVGYCKTGYEGIYNIQMIEEKETIIGCGVDSVTKLVFLDENRIERTANKKDINEYIKTIDTAVDKKLDALETLNHA